MSVLRFEKNLLGKDYVVGDIHGCFSKLQAALDETGFNPEVDRLFSTGDLVDRGPESELAQEWLAKPWFHAVRGNHEEMAIEFAQGYLDAYSLSYNGGAWLIALTQPERMYFADLFETLPLVIEVETDSGKVGIIHAETPYAEWDYFVNNVERCDVKNACIWGRERFHHKEDNPVTGVDRVFVGHTPTKQPLQLANIRYIDTGAVFGGAFTIERIQ